MIIKSTIEQVFRFLLSPILFKTYVGMGRSVGILRKSATPPAGEIQRIFVSFPSNYLGDNVFLMPFLELLHKVWPEAGIHLATGEHMASLMKAIPFIEEVFAFPAVAHRGLLPWRVRELRATLSCYEKHAADYSYDLAFSPRWQSDLDSVTARHLLYLTNARKRCAYSATVDGGSSSLDTLLTDAAYGGQLEHEALRYLELLERLSLAGGTEGADALLRRPNKLLQGIAEGYSNELVTEMVRQKAGQSLAEYAVISPGATSAARRWPRERFAGVIRELNRLFDLKFLVVGGRAERELCDSLASEFSMSAFSIGGKTTLSELVAILHRAILFIGNDSGVGHVAAGLGVPTVSIHSFPSDPRHRHLSARVWPNGPRVSVVQPEDALAPCSGACEMKHPHCINQVSEDKVVQTAIGWLEPTIAAQGERSDVRF